MRTRESWFQKHTNAVQALNQLLKDSQYKNYEKRLKLLEESGRTLRRVILKPGLLTKRLGALRRRGEAPHLPD